MSGFANPYPSNYTPTTRPSSTAVYYPSSGYNTENYGQSMGGTGTPSAGAMRGLTSNIQGVSSTSTGQFTGGGTGFNTEAPEQIARVLTEEQRADIDARWAVEPYVNNPDHTYQEYVNDKRKWEREERDFKLGARSLAYAMGTMGGNEEENAALLIAKAGQGKNPQTKREFARRMGAYLVVSRNELLTDKLLSVGYTPEEIEELDFVQNIDTDSFSTRGGGFDFDAWSENLNTSRQEQGQQFFDLYDTKFVDNNEEQTKNFTQLKKEDPVAFMEAYGAADTDTRNRYLYAEHKAGNLTAKEYKQNVAKNLALSGRKLAEVEGKYYYTEGREGSSDTSYNMQNGEFVSPSDDPLTNTWYEVNFFPEEYEKNAVSRYSGAGEGTQGLRGDGSTSNVVMGVDDLGQMLVTQGFSGYGLPDEQFADHQKNEFLNHGIGSRGAQVNPFEDKLRDEFLAVLRVGAAIVTGGTSEALYSAYKGLKGDTLHASDWLNLASFGIRG